MTAPFPTRPGVASGLFLRIAAAWMLAAGALTAAESAFAPAAATNAPASNRKTVDWRDLETPAYPQYLERLRAAGLPEDKVRLIVAADGDEWLLQQRIELAVKHDFEWWKAEAPTVAGAGAAEGFGELYAQLQARRAELVSRLAGIDAAEAAGPTNETRGVVNLGGRVLGGLPREKYNAVQEICARSLDRNLGYYNSRQNEGVFLNQGDLARLREQTRSDLADLLTPEELEEFLLRYSHNANRLRTELAPMEPTPEEFRKVFRAVDALEHRLQLEFGAIDSLSARQREQFEREREEVVKQALAPDRYQRYLMGRYPLFRQARLAVQRAGLAESVVLPFYEVLNQHESRRREILNNSALNSEQRQTALQTLERDKETGLQKALGEDGYKQYRESLVN